MKLHRSAVAVLIVCLSVVFVMTVSAYGSPLQTNRDSTPAVESPNVTLGQPGLSFRYVQTFGVTEEAYLADAQHLNHPNGLFIDSGDNLYVVEELGHRLLKYRLSDNANLLSIGKAGLQNRDTYTFDSPKDVTVDGGGHIWAVDNQRAVEYDASGVFMQEFPAADPWNSGSDNSHFNEPRGIVFDSAGRMYISDRQNHRVQIYDMSGPSPVYSTTVGETGVSGTDNAHFNYPTQIAIDSSGRLYVIDQSNYRVQRCTYAAGAWTCATFLGETGVPGNDLYHLAAGWINGLVIKGNDFYIADSLNNRVLKCDLSGACSLFAGASDSSSGTDNSHFDVSADVAVDSHGNVYASDFTNDRILKFTSSGGTAVGLLGTTLTPYVPDTSRYNTPKGLTVAADGSIYFTEGYGYRLVKLNAAGAQQWAVGQAGVNGTDNAHFNGVLWDGLAGNAAVDAAGRVYVPDTGNDRIQIFSTNTGTFITTWGSSGSGQSQFSCPWGVAISPVNGDFYLVDRCNNRIQIFDSNRVYKTQLGTGMSGSSNTEFAGPSGVAVDKQGNVFVADQDNNRVQKCTVSGVNYNCALFAGVTGQSGDDFGHLSGSYSVAVDDSGRVYVVDPWNQRVQVFDSTGAYLTTIGGSYGSSSGQMREPKAMGLDSQGNVYVADSKNSRIQKFAPGVPGWRQKNVNGFGERWNANIEALTVFNGQLYTGVGNWTDGARIWRTADGSNWAAASDYGFGAAYTTTNRAVIGMAVFNNQLYAGAGWGGAPGQLWRSSNGTTWSQITGNGIGESSGSFSTFAVYSNTLYVGTCGDANGAQIWRSTIGDSLSWTNVVTGGNGTTDNGCLTGLKEFNGALYTAIENGASGAQIWRSTSGDDGAWAQTNASGFGSAANAQTGGFAIFNGQLYIGTLNNTTGAQLWRSNNGTTWTPVMTDGFGDVNNYKLESLFVFENALYAATDNSVSGVQVWRSTDGANWIQFASDGFGDSNNDGILWSNATVAFNNSFYIGTWNWNGNGGEIWQLFKQVYLPVVIRN